jgi:GNAT superfamily N-acetyltransferase
MHKKLKTGEILALNLRDEGLGNTIFVDAYINDQVVGYATFKPAKNRYANGYRIADYWVAEAHRLKGVASAMVACFERRFHKTLIPSQIFGAKGKMTKDGMTVAIKRLKTTKPSWLPSGWEEFIERPLA